MDEKSGESLATRLIAALTPFAAIADEWDKCQLYGLELPFPSFNDSIAQCVLIRDEKGNRQLLTVADCYAARAAVRELTFHLRHRQLSMKL